MKKFIVLTLLGLMTFTGFSFADDTTEKISKERLGQTQEERMINYREKMTEIVETFSPDLLNDFILLWDQHEAIHLNLKALKEAHKLSLEAQRTSFTADMKDLIQNEEMTRKEVKLIFEEKKSEQLALRENLKLELENLKDNYAISKENFKTLNQALKDMTQQEDRPAVASQLNSLLSYLENHLAFDLDKYDLLLNGE